MSLLGFDLLIEINGIMNGFKYKYMLESYVFRYLHDLEEE